MGGPIEEEQNKLTVAAVKRLFPSYCIRGNPALQAIKYMYTVHKKVLKDFRYPKMEKLKMENEILH
jgi:hypothetical protein